MRVKSVKKNPVKKTVYDIETPTHDYILSNGVVSHNTMEAYSKPVFSGGTGPMLNCDTVIIVGRRKRKEKVKGKDVHVGYDFVLNIEKSRFVREGTQLIFSANFEEGIDIYGGLLDLALDTGHVYKPKMGWFARTHMGDDDKNWRRKETSCPEFWNPIFDDTDFEHVVHESLMIGGTRTMFTVEDDDSDKRALEATRTDTAERLKKSKEETDNVDESD